jgi:hypothetical protein
MGVRLGSMVVAQRIIGGALLARGLEAHSESKAILLA